ncbi:MAG: hypothetical protein M1818_005323 [Claussenomyces sp. TS43310]|nr:MAG: hypothetical protein M1818_005323 [Claussenomyces sp. TS43310]
MSDFSRGPEEITVRGMLFDMDGTIIDSTNAIIKHWYKLGKELGVDPEVILASSHGRRSIDTLKLYDPTKANMEYVSQMEAQLPKLYGHDANEIPGSRALLDATRREAIPWAIVTSATKPLVTGWLSVLALPTPENLITAEDVEDGKPDPACYRMALSALGLGTRAEDVLVLEDAPAGIRAGKAAGCKVLALVTSHTVQQVSDAGPDWVVRDLRSVRIVEDAKGDGFRLEIRNALVNIAGHVQGE